MVTTIIVLVLDVVSVSVRVEVVESVSVVRMVVRKVKVSVPELVVMVRTVLVIVVGSTEMVVDVSVTV